MVEKEIIILQSKELQISIIQDNYIANQPQFYIAKPHLAAYIILKTHPFRNPFHARSKLFLIQLLAL
ncbi:hypothetical protein GCM10007940_41460 [Portibacter lacus]|uniref:Uncharacterized protein n=1 Tax=Portibacter lacus TaxID=1099794 RepID=A0AA37WIA7_9BACT|nr:hypothetical protein GCM10007940_41460 [Portibacter lacus]